MKPLPVVAAGRTAMVVAIAARTGSNSGRNPELRRVAEPIRFPIPVPSLNLNPSRSLNLCLSQFQIQSLSLILNQNQILYLPNPGKYSGGFNSSRFRETVRGGAGADSGWRLFPCSAVQAALTARQLGYPPPRVLGQPRRRQPL
jgi:hypothetical protein